MYNSKRIFEDMCEQDLHDQAQRDRREWLDKQEQLNKYEVRKKKNGKDQ